MNQNTGTQSGGDDYDANIYSFDEDDFFIENPNNSTNTMIDNLPQRAQGPAALEIPMTISNSAIRLVQQSISRIKNSASSAGLFGSEEKSNSESKGNVFNILIHPIPIRSSIN